ncbi:MAG TPA: PilN domain-containing protein, partial [Dissulfurispiraceae bacterium]
ETDPGICIPGRQTEGAADGTPYAAVGGAVESLQPEAKGMNLLTRGRSRMSKTPMALTAVLALCLLAVWAAYVIAPLNVEEKRLAEIERQIKLKKSSMKGVESLQKEIGQWEDELSAIDEFKNGRPMSAAIVKELTALLPKTVWLTRLRATATTVEIEGYAGSATELLPRLESSKYFRKAEFASPTFRDMRMNADRFNIKMEIKGDAEE